jgi:chromosome segregation ATPase
MDNLLKRAARSMVHRAGLVTRGRADTLARALERAQAKIADLKKDVETARAETKAWRANAAAAATQVNALKAQLESARLQPAKTRAAAATDVAARRGDAAAPADKRAARFEHDLDEMRERHEKHRARLAELRDKAQWSESALRLAREQLMAVEVKLDIIEGAVTVLDNRTRAALAAGDAADKTVGLNMRDVT